MSDDPGTEPEVRLTTDSFDLRKRASRSSTEYPVFEYRVDYRGSPGELRVTESLPSAVDADDVEFHPDFHGDNWSCDDDAVTFEYILPEAEVVETKFGLSIDDPAVTEDLLTGPEVVVDDLETGDPVATYGPADATVVAPDPGDGMAPVEPDPVSDTVREIVLGESPVDDASSPADVEEPIAAAPPGDPESTATATAADADSEDASDRGDTADQTASASASGDGTPAPASASGDRPEAADLAADGVGAALAAELRAGTMSEDDLAVVREALAAEGSESDRVRLRDLQARYHDLAAYTDALEAFVDEHGDADGVLADVQSDLAALEARVEELSGTGERVEAVEDRLARLEETVADLEEQTEVLLELQDVFGSD